MKKYLIIFALLVATNLYAQRPENRPSRNPLDQGADACNGTLISSLPYTDSGTTVGMTNNFSTAANCGSSVSPDVIYRYVSTTFGNVTVVLNGTDYDEVVEVRSGGACPGATQIICGTDDFGAPPQVVFEIVPGTTYYIIIEGWAGGSGNYTLSVSAPVPCGEVQMQPWDILECTGEAPDSVTQRTDCDGGCNVNPRLWGTIACGQTIYGQVFTYNNPINGGNRRDNDAYHFTLTDTSDVTIVVFGEVSMYGMIRNAGCPWTDTLAFTGPSTQCDGAVATAHSLPPGTYTYLVMSTVTTGVTTPANYRASLYCSPAGFVCDVDYAVAAPYTSPERTTCGAGHDCGVFNTTDDVVYQVWIPYYGQWQISMCDSNSGSWDGYMTVGDDCCSPDFWWWDRDAGCQSQIMPSGSVDVNSPVIYITVTGHPAGPGCGPYILSIQPYMPPQCPEAEELTIKRNGTNNSVQMDWIATQTSGSYRIYRTIQPNNDGDPNNGSDPQWTQIADLPAPVTPDTMTYTDGGLSGRAYSNYVVVHVCAPFGRCCYGHGVLCENVVEADCNTFNGGVWTAGQTCEGAPCPYGSDLCFGAFNSPVYADVPVYSDNFDATTDGDWNADCGAITYDADVWFTYTATTTGWATLSMCFPVNDFPVAVVVKDGCQGSALVCGSGGGDYTPLCQWGQWPDMQFYTTLGSTYVIGFCSTRRFTNGTYQRGHFAFVILY